MNPSTPPSHLEWLAVVTDQGEAARYSCLNQNSKKDKITFLKLLLFKSIEVKTYSHHWTKAKAKAGAQLFCSAVNSLVTLFLSRLWRVPGTLFMLIKFPSGRRIFMADGAALDVGIVYMF